MEGREVGKSLASCQLVFVEIEYSEDAVPKQVGRDNLVFLQIEREERWALDLRQRGDLVCHQVYLLKVIHFGCTHEIDVSYLVVLSLQL